jgi:TIR domain
VKVFVSHTMKDRQVAESVYSDLQNAGAQVYQFGESESLGGDAWEQILTWISDSDAFVVLLSRHTLGSKGVKAEIEHANHSYINKNRPSAVIPTLVQTGVHVPVLIERFTQLNLVDYKKGIAKLIAELDLKPANRIQLGKTASKAKPFDSDAILALSGKPTPLPRATELWAKDATKILSNYKKADPPDMPKDKETTYLDGLLAEYSGKRRKPTLSDEALGIFESRLRSASTPSPAKPKAADTSKAAVSDMLLGFDKSKFTVPLKPPTLNAETWKLTWSAVPYATGYVLESAADEQFSTPKEVYRGSATTQFALFDLGQKYYRVRALGGLLFADSPWSNTVYRQLAYPGRGGLISFDE